SRRVGSPKAEVMAVTAEANSVGDNPAIGTPASIVDGPDPTPVEVVPVGTAAIAPAYRNPLSAPVRGRLGFHGHFGEN
ncbi:MAG: hypothetical protein KDB13_01990, partial [Microthrixaceae bacterium]|nr:hypothetical protein [Microthrixaceae bacterium]